MWWNRNRIMKCHSVLVVIINSFIVFFNMLQKKVVLETFLGFHRYEQNCSNFIKYIFPHDFLNCFQMEQLKKYTSKRVV
jgi:hypothetical protein